MKRGGRDGKLLDLFVSKLRSLTINLELYETEFISDFYFGRLDRFHKVLELIVVFFSCTIFAISLCRALHLIIVFSSSTADTS